MNKIATQLLEQAKSYINENPELIRNVLGAGVVGAGAGGLLFGGGDKNEPTDKKVKRRLKNALLGGLMAGGAAGLLTHGGKQLATAMPAQAETPMEAVESFPSSLKARLGYTAAGGILGHKVKKELEKDGLNVLKNTLRQKGIANAHLIPDATTGNRHIARAAAEEVLDNLRKNPADFQKAFDLAEGTKNRAAKVKKITKLFRNAGIDTSTMLAELPEATKIPIKADPSKIAEKAMTEQPLSSKMLKKLKNIGRGNAAMAGLMTAGAFAPELFRVGKGAYDLLP